MNEASLKERAREELRLYAVVAGYLYVCFAILVLFETTLSQQGGSLFPHGFAVIKALVVGKFLLIGRAIDAGGRIGTKTVAGRIGLRTVGLLLTLLVLTVIEEAIVGAIHGHAVGATVAEIFGSPRYAVFAKAGLMTLLLIPLVALEELNQALGRGVLRATLLGPPRA